MTVTTLSTHPQMAEAEWQTRCDLAALYHILHYYRMTDMIYTHMTARVPGEDGTFLINSYGDLFDEITASSLLKMDMDGKVIGDDAHYNEAGFTIHSGVYKARPDVQCVMHTHTRAGIAISITKKGLLPISQDAALLMGDLAYHDYGTPSTQTECEALGQSCQKANNIILRNHGLLTVGRSIPSTFSRMYRLEHACSAQVAAMSMNDELIEISPQVLAEVEKKYGGFDTNLESGQLEWSAMLRLLDRLGTDYRR